jgi:hypothetical protein
MSATSASICGKHDEARDGDDPEHGNQYLFRALVHRLCIGGDLDEVLGRDLTIALADRRVEQGRDTMV